MADARIFPGRLCGRLDAPPSKSAAHRALICAALANGESLVSPLSPSADIEATAQVLCAMGAQIARTGAAAAVCGGPCASHPVPLDCKESGSTLRFLLPVAAALGLTATFTGTGRLPERPIGLLLEQLKAHGVTVSAERLPFTLRGRLTGGLYELPGDVSSQFISGLLFALPLLPEESELCLTSPLQSAGYVALTLAALKEAGIRIAPTARGFAIEKNQTYLPGNRTVEGDWSNAAFWLCAGAIGGDVRIAGLDAASPQGDRAILALLERFGAKVERTPGFVRVQHAPLFGCRIDAGEIPDLAPILAVTAAFAHGDTEIYNAARLRIKESDRLATTAALLQRLGGQAEEFPDRLVIHGGGLVGGAADGANDHRIVMAAAVAGLFCKEPVSISGIQAVNKSYPHFFEELNRLGGRCDVINLG